MISCGADDLKDVIYETSSGEEIDEGGVHMQTIDVVDYSKSRITDYPTSVTGTYMRFGFIFRLDD